MILQVPQNINSEETYVQREAALFDYTLPPEERQPEWEEGERLTFDYD